MPTEFESFGYEDLRTYLQNNWNWIAVVDDGNTEQLRWDVDANANTSWTSGPASNPLTAELTITGQDIVDAGGSLPVTLNRTETYKSSGATTRTSTDTFTGATLETTNDQVIISHDYEMPQI
jgi:hypothetical protein